MQRQEIHEKDKQEIYEKDGRQYFFNPKPDSHANNRSVPATYNEIYGKETSAKKNPVRYADNGHFVPHIIPIYRYPIGKNIYGYYTIENSKPRECFRHKSYRKRREIKYPGIKPNYKQNLHVDVGSKLSIVYNTGIGTKYSYSYITDTKKPEVDSKVAITELLFIHTNTLTKSHPRYIVITKEGYCDPVVTKKNIEHRPISLEWYKKDNYKQEVKQLKEKEINQRKQREKDNKRKLLDDNIPTLSKKLKHTHENNFIDNSMEVPSSPSLSNHEPQQLPTAHVLNTVTQPVKFRFTFSITKEELEEENRRLACEQADMSHSSVEEDEVYQSKVEEPLKPIIIETPDASSIKVVGKGQDIIRPQPLVTQDNFFKPRQQTSSVVAQTKQKAIEARRSIEQRKKETIIFDSEMTGVKEKLNNLQPSHPHIQTGKKKENISPPTNRPRSSSLNALFPPQPEKNNTEKGLKRKMNLLKKRK